MESCILGKAEAEKGTEDSRWANRNDSYKEECWQVLPLTHWGAEQDTLAL